MRVAFCLLAYKIVGRWEGCSVVDVNILSFANPFPEDVTESRDERPLFFLAVLKLCQQEILVDSLHSIDLAKHVGQEFGQSFHRYDRGIHLSQLITIQFS